LRGTRQQQHVWRYTDLFEALTVGHNQISTRDRGPIKNEHSGIVIEPIEKRLHDAAGTLVTDHGASMLQLHHAGEQLSSGRRLAIHQHDQISCEHVAAPGFRDLWFLPLAHDARCNRHIVIDHAANQARKSRNVPTRIAAKIEYQRLVRSSNPNHPINFALLNCEDRHLPEHNVPLLNEALAHQLLLRLALSLLGPEITVHGASDR
jgi:hypothetical protein